ncbi:MAG: SH3 domain-containing protein [Acidobacteria bacterium]|nr:SH3 domain-containing protein [Acidobacteriota bacterium]
MTPRSLLAAAILLAAPFVAAAQDPDLARFGRIETTAKTTVRSAPRFGSQLVRRLEPGVSLRWIEGRRVDDFLRVAVPKGGIGWIPADDVRITAEAPPPEEAITAGEQCAANLDACPEHGCASPQSKIGLRNVAKRRTPAGATPIRMSFTDFASLQDQTDQLFEESQGREFDADDRALLQGFDVSNGTVGEATLVRITGFLSVGKRNPHPNTSGESVNCNIKQTANNDFHISIASSSTKDEFDGIVIEAIPQDRPGKWTIPRLKKVKTQKRKVWVEGGLFYDNPHVVNSDPDSGSSQPKRFSLWEIHPINRILVCTKTNNACNNNDESQWTRLEDVP